MSEEDISYFFCGTSDSITAEQIAAWRKKVVYWQILGDLPGISRDSFKSAIFQAFASWQAVCDLSFAEAGNSSPDIIITTGRIDRSGGVLAWSELPDGSDRQLQQKYDTSESFVIAMSPPRGKIDLLAVATHEIGHALGLEHAANGSPDLMAPIYQPGRRTPQPGDVARIQKLYPKVMIPDPVPPTEETTVVIRITGATRISVDGYKVEKL